MPLTVRTASAPQPDGGTPAVRELTFSVDEGPRRDTSAEALAKLRPAFHVDGTVTAGNASQMSDGAAAVLLLSAERARELRRGTARARSSHSPPPASNPSGSGLVRCRPCGRS